MSLPVGRENEGGGAGMARVGAGLRSRVGEEGVFWEVVAGGSGRGP